MKLLSFASALLATAVVATFAPAAGAVEISRTDLLQAPGACTSTAPGDNLRYSVGGVRNVGATDVYITCALSGDPNVGATATGAYHVSVRVFNHSVLNHNIQCTLYGGSGSGSSTTTQGAASIILNIKAGENDWFAFYPSQLPGAPSEIANATFICKAPQNVGVFYVYRDYNEQVGL